MKTVHTHGSLDTRDMKREVELPVCSNGAQEVVEEALQ